MKKLFSACLVTLLAIPVSLYARENQNAISVDVFLPAMSPVSYLAGEHMIALDWHPYDTATHNHPPFHPTR